MLDSLVESPDPLESLLDKDSRRINPCTAVAAAISGLPDVEAARILVYAAATIEEKMEGVGCLSILIGEAVQLQARGRSLELEELATQFPGEDLHMRTKTQHLPGLVIDPILYLLEHESNPEGIIYNFNISIR